MSYDIEFFGACFFEYLFYTLFQTFCICFNRSGTVLIAVEYLTACFFKRKIQSEQMVLKNI